MGYHKRFITLNHILERYSNNDLSRIKQYLKSDALIIETGPCNYIVDKILSGDDYGAILIINYELSR